MSDLELSWTLDLAGGSLRLAYRVHNRGKAPVWLVDRMIVFGERRGFDPAPVSVVVREDRERRGRVRLIRGFVDAESDVQIEVVPGARRAGPGERLEGHAEAPWPLAAWHPNDGSRELDPPPHEAVLEVGWLADGFAFDPLTLNDGSVLEIPHPADLFEHQRWMRTPPRPLPPPAAPH